MHEDGRRPTGVELCISEQLDEMNPIAWLHMIALQMERDILERHGIAVDIKGPHRIRIIAILFSRLQLTLEKLGKV